MSTAVYVAVAAVILSVFLVRQRARWRQRKAGPVRTASEHMDELQQSLAEMNNTIDLYREGATAYKAGRWEAAIYSFERSLAASTALDEVSGIEASEAMLNDAKQRLAEAR